MNIYLFSWHKGRTNNNEDKINNIWIGQIVILNIAISQKCVNLCIPMIAEVAPFFPSNVFTE